MFFHCALSLSLHISISFCLSLLFYIYLSIPLPVPPVSPSLLTLLAFQFFLFLFHLFPCFPSLTLPVSLSSYLLSLPLFRSLSLSLLLSLLSSLVIIGRQYFSVSHLIPLSTAFPAIISCRFPFGDHIWWFSFHDVINHMVHQHQRFSPTHYCFYSFLSPFPFPLFSLMGRPVFNYITITLLWLCLMQTTSNNRRWLMLNQLECMVFRYCRFDIRSELILHFRSTQNSQIAKEYIFFLHRAKCFCDQK